MRHKRAITLLAAILCILFFQGSVSAEVRAGSYTLTPHVGGYVFDGDQDLDDGPVYGIGLGYNYTENFGVEAVFDYIDTEDEQGGTERDGYIYRIDALYHFMPEMKLVPYVAAGLGAITLETASQGDETEGLFNYGAGLKYDITETLALRGDIRHLIDFDDPNNNLAYTLGLTFLFGGEKKAAAPMPRPEPKDSDGDGVYDDMDLCPDTPYGVQVDMKGCPLDSDKDGVYDHLDLCPGTPYGTRVDMNGCPDSDNDGVSDHMDRCPGTPPAAPVDSTGCPTDSDMDGVYDYMDRCPGTPAGTKVNVVGCPVPMSKKVTMELNIEFDTDKAEIRPIYHDKIRDVADFLKNHPGARAVIEGHTDSVGAAQYNLNLSTRRAEAVMRYLMDSFGIAGNRLTAKGYGESDPVADNATKEGRQRNRRVIAVISGMTPGL